MTYPDLFTDYKGKIKNLNKKIKKLKAEIIMNKRTALIFRLKCLIQKCRQRGKFKLAIKLKDKLYAIDDVNTNYNNISDKL
tara:strand:+ start:77 stop:319 length:243 start_codon:yes stop_codon:yes gene_type:complete